MPLSAAYLCLATALSPSIVMNRCFFPLLVFTGTTLLAACSQDVPRQQAAPATAAARASTPTDSAVTAATLPTSAGTSEAPAATPQTVYQLLQGKWQSTTDPLDVVEFKNHDYIDYYDRRQLSRKTFQLNNACPGAKAAGGVGNNERYLVVDDMCWHIAMLDGNSLELEYIDGGKILFYSKINP